MENITVPLLSITYGPYNLRGENAENSPTLKDLSDCIWRDGLLHLPGVIDNGDGTYTIVYGHRRFWAIVKHQSHLFPMLPVHLIPKDEADEIHAVRKAIAENFQREAINPIALAKKLVTLRKAGLSNHEIAEVIGYETASAVTAVIQLLDLEPEVQERLITGELAFGHGKALLQLRGKPDEQLHAVEVYNAQKKEDRIVRTMEHIVQAIKRGEEWIPLPLHLPKSVKHQELAHGSHRLLISFTSVEDLREQLTTVLAGIETPEHYHEKGLYDRIREAFG